MRDGDKRLIEIPAKLLSVSTNNTSRFVANDVACPIAFEFEDEDPLDGDHLTFAVGIPMSDVR